MTGWGRRALLVVAGVAPALLVVGCRDATSGGRWATVERGELRLTVEVSGSLAAVQSDLLGPPAIPRVWNFEISHLAPEGETVEAGERVLAFDATGLEERLSEYVAERDQAAKQIEKLRQDFEIRQAKDDLELAEAEARLRLARLKLERPPEVVAAQELQTTALDLELAERETAYHGRRRDLDRRRHGSSLDALVQKRDRAAERVREIERQIASLEVTAPHAGTVIHYSDEHSQKSKVGDSVWRAATVIEIPDLSRMQALGEVEEIAAGRVAVGQPVTLRLDAHPDLVYPGRVASIERAVRRRSDVDPTKVFRLRVELDETDALRMRPGMRFRGSIEVEVVEDVLLVPLAAVSPSPAGARVWVRGLGGSGPVVPVLGRRSSDRAEVVSGLEAGDLVALDRPRSRR